MPSRIRIGAATLPLVIAAAAAAIFVANAVSYFFLLDDLIITNQAIANSTWQLLSQPQFNFYRPIADLWLKGLYAVFGWQHPAGFVAMSMLLHATCALLVRVLARQCGLDRTASTFAGVLFLLSPWATEPILWPAASCDSLPTLGLLGCVVAALSLVGDTRGETHAGPAPPSAWPAFVLGAASAAWALLSKEIGVLASPLLILAVGFVRGPRALLQRRTALYVLVIIVLTGAYLVVREQILPGLGGGYGPLSALFGRGSIAHNVRAFAVALFVLPFPDGVTGAGVTAGRVAAAVFAVASVALLVTGLVSRWRLGVLCGAAALTSIAPVLWATLVPGNTSGNRFLYLPGVWFAVLLAAGTARLRGAVRGIAAAVILILATTSLYYQARIWRDASRLSRAAIDQLRPYADSSAPLFITNLPGLYADGPYVLNTLAVTSYFHGAFPPIDGNRMALKFDRGATIFSFWLTERRAARAGERTVTLDVPVWTAEPHPLAEVETPARGATVTQPFAIRGWAIDANARQGTGIDLVNVYAYPVPGTDAQAVLLGRARDGEARVDVARRYGARFAPSGFTLEASGLPPGRYRLAVFVRSAVGRTRDPVWTAEVTVER